MTKAKGKKYDYDAASSSMASYLDKRREANKKKAASKKSSKSGYSRPGHRN